MKINGFKSYWVMRWPQIEDEASAGVALSYPAQYLLKLRENNPCYPVFKIKGYRLKLVSGSHIPANEAIQPGIVYMYSDNRVLFAALINADGVLLRTPLNHIHEHDGILKKFLTLTNTSGQGHELHLLDENTIFHALNCEREASVAPYFDARQASDEDIANELLDIYRRTRKIIIDASSPGCFLMRGDQATLVEKDDALLRQLRMSIAFLNDKKNKAACATFWANIDLLLGESKASAMIKTLLYLELYLQPRDIANEYVEPNVIKQLHVFREQNEPFDVPTMEILLFILYRCANSGLPNLLIPYELVTKVKDNFKTTDNFDEITPMIKAFIAEQQALQQKTEDDAQLLDFLGLDWSDDGLFGETQLPQAMPSGPVSVDGHIEGLKQNSMFASASSNSMMVGRKHDMTDTSDVDVTDDDFDNTAVQDNKRQRGGSSFH